MIPFQRNYTDHLFSNSIPRADELVATLSAAAAPGEREPILMGVHATEAIKEATVSVSDLALESGEVIAASHATVRIVREIPKRHLYSPKWTKDYTMMPMVLEPSHPFSIRAGESQGVWIDILAPADAKPGLYHGQVSVRVRGKEMRLPIELEVYPFQLAEPKAMFYGAYTTMLEAGEYANPEAVLQEMRESGMTTLGYCDPWARIEPVPGGAPVATLEPYAKKVMEAYRKVGFTLPILQLNDPILAYARRVAKVTDERFYEEYLAGAKALHTAMVEQQFPPIYLQPLDEPSWHGDDAKALHLRLMTLLKKQGLFMTEHDGPIDQYLTEEVGPHADMWVLNGNVLPADALEKARQVGKKVLIYNTDVEAWRPIVSRYSAGYLQWRFGMDGVLQWEYQNPNISEKTYNEIEEPAENGYFGFFYPATRESPGGPTISWVAFREGIDDYRYLLTLQAAIAAARNTHPDLAAEIEGKLALLKESLKPLLRIRNQGGWSVAGSDPQGKYIGGKFNLANGWEPEDYNKHRRQIARWIETLQAAMR